MPTNIFHSVKQAIGNLDPQEVRNEAERPFRIGLHASNDASFHEMQRFFEPANASDQRLMEIDSILRRANNGEPYDIEIFSQELIASDHGYSFSPVNPERTVREVLARRPDLALPLGRYIAPFRKPVAQQIISKISKENALFSVATALPDIVPLLSLPWAIGEFASDTAFITANQIRMGFLLAAASDHAVGYREQKAEIASLLVGAFGWRSLARELVGHIPLGGGLLPKAAIAYAGTRVVGMSMERYYRIGYGFSRTERRAAYEKALQRGKTVANALMAGLKHLPSGSRP